LVYFDRGAKNIINQKLNERKNRLRNTEYNYFLNGKYLLVWQPISMLRLASFSILNLLSIYKKDKHKWRLVESAFISGSH
jgi:hypothetical protein